METIHERHDTLFGGKLPAPSAATLRALQTHVIEHKCDIGIATDGDADRIGVIDDTGRFLHPNDILVLLYYYLVKYKGWKGPVVRNICTTHRLDRMAEEFGQQCYEVPVGFKHISAKISNVYIFFIKLNNSVNFHKKCPPYNNNSILFLIKIKFFQ